MKSKRYPFFAMGMLAVPLMGANKPNIIVIMTDQQRADLCGREGFPLDVTPCLDRLAKSGTWFNRAYTSSPASVPARTSLMTGRFPKATRVRSNHNVEDAVFENDIFRTARKCGYQTALIGKNHTYLTERDVDYWSPYEHTGQLSKSAARDPFDQFLKSLNFYASFEPSPYGLEHQIPYRMVDDAEKWIDSVQDSSFLLLLSFPEPHCPYQVCEPYFSMFPPGKIPPEIADSTSLSIKGKRFVQLHDMMKIARGDFDTQLPKLRSIYLGMIRMIDDQIARFTGDLRNKKLLDKTIILFLSDHGDYAGEYGLMNKGVGLPEVLSRISMLWTGPGIKSGEKPHEAHVSIVDVYPTLCEIMGTEIPVGVQGRSLWELLQGEPYPAGEFESVMVEQGYGGAYYTEEDGTDYEAEGCLSKGKKSFDCLNTWTQSGSMRMLRKGDWKLIYDMEGNGALYHLKKDPAELVNLFDRKSAQNKKAELMQDLLRWEIATQDPLPLPQRRYRFKRHDHNYLFFSN